MTFFVQTGTIFRAAEDGSFLMHDRLPAGTYTVVQDLSGFYFKQIEDFGKMGKIYGNTINRADRFLSTFHDRPSSTGILLSGEKGSGKTLLAKLIAQKALTEGIPTVVINQPFCGEGFNLFMQSITQPLVVLFDEFEKVYDEQAQEQLLTLLDGVYPSKKLFILTANNRYIINANMTNRPGRLFYAIDYKGLDAEFIREYCEDNLDNKVHIEAMARMCMVFEQFNFDMLKAMVEEMNRYKETPMEVLELLNAKPNPDTTTHNIVIVRDGVEMEVGKFEPSHLRGNPLQVGEIELTLDLVEETEENGYDSYKNSTTLKFGAAALKSINSTEGTFTYAPQPNITVKFSKHKVKAATYDRVLGAEF